MEATRESQTFLDKIKPPRLEEAGLEDCALPPESIMEAFRKASSALKSAFSTHNGVDSEGNCVDDPWEDSFDALVGITDGVVAPTDGCTREKGRGLEADEDVVIVGGGEGESDEILGSDFPEGGEACVDGLQGLEIGEKSKGDLGKKKGDLKDADADEDEEESDRDKPILAENLV